MGQDRAGQRGIDTQHAVIQTRSVRWYLWLTGIPSQRTLTALGRADPRCPRSAAAAPLLLSAMRSSPHAHRSPSSPGVVSQLTGLKADLRAEQNAYLAGVKAARAHNGKHRPASATRQRTHPLHASTSSDDPQDAALSNYIAQKQAALDSSKAELERSLQLTRTMEAAFEQERRTMQEMHQTQRANEQTQWNGANADPAQAQEYRPATPQQQQGQTQQSFQQTQPAQRSVASPSPARYSAASLAPHQHDETYAVEDSWKGARSAQDTREWRRPTRDQQLSGAPPISGVASGKTRLHRAAAGLGSHKTHAAGKQQTDRPSLLARLAGFDVDQSIALGGGAGAVVESAVPTAELVASLPSNKKVVLDLFRNFDVNCTGSVNSNEFASALSVAGLGFDVPQIKQIVAALDRDNRGEIRYINLLSESDASFAQRASTSERSTLASSGAFSPGVAKDTATGLPLSLFAEPAKPQDPSVFVPIPPYDSMDLSVVRALRTRQPQSHALAILRTQDRRLLDPATGEFGPTGQPPQMPREFRALTAQYATSSADYFARPPGFVERPYSHALGATTIPGNHLASPHAFKPSNSEAWGAVRGAGDAPAFGARASPLEFDRNYTDAINDPQSAAGSTLRALSVAVHHNPRRFLADMRAFDACTSSRVTTGDFLTGLQRLGVNIPNWRLQELVRGVDRHNTGSIKYEEVAQALAHYSEKAGAVQQSGAQAIADAAAAAPVAAPSPSAAAAPAAARVGSVSALAADPRFAFEGIANHQGKHTAARHAELEWARREKQALQQIEEARLATEGRMKQEEEKQQMQQGPSTSSNRLQQQAGYSQYLLERQQQLLAQQKQLQAQQAELQAQQAQERDRQQQQQMQLQQQQLQQLADMQVSASPAPSSMDVRDGSWVDYSPHSSPVDTQSEAPPQQQAPLPPADVTLSPTQVLHPQSPVRAKYPYQLATSEERERLARAMQQANATAAPSQPQAHPAFEAQAGTALPVLAVEYPPSARPRTTAGPTAAAARRPRSRSSSVSSIRSHSSVRSTAASTAGRDLEAGFRAASRAGSRRGSFSQAARTQSNGTGTEQQR